MRLPPSAQSASGRLKFAPYAVLSTCLLILTACGNPDGGGGGGTDQICQQAVLPASVLAASTVPSTVSAPDWNAPHVPGELLVTHAAGGLSGGKLSAQAVRALGMVTTEAVTPTLTIATISNGETEQALATKLEAAGLTVQPNFLYQPLAVPNDPGYRSGIQVSDTTLTQTYLPRIKAQAAWDFLAACGKTPASVKTAVLDTGADSRHPDLAGRLISARNYTGNTVNADTSDTDGHGTAVIGLLGAATNNAAGVAAVTWSGQNLMPYKVLGAGGGSTAQVAQALNDAVAEGAKVVNMSFGIQPSAYGQDPGDRILDAALTAAAKNAVLVAAAGNTANDGVYYPASNPNVIAVGAIGIGNSLACYSARPNNTYTRSLDLVAPGGGGGCAGTTLKDNMLVLGLTSADDGHLGKYSVSAGTSEAAPLVSGVASLMLAANPALTAPQTRALLLSTADKGSVSGYALLDALAAVKAATQ
ncbi:S8 family peptidase [Deinococcus aquatilis]|uniref:S8 family peptidase n=1 Tax=Deinococcus aquatilis TaxID=519440 RepID=UPI000381735B|nr:S8 family serine peptidase [Deinococcus aquatilis]